ncbi:cytochrome c551 [Sporosarcina ureilytica]|uniref:cytochrome c551 n=1 Tax=Sporosarcina ureilytica TaxID=298596 RepID=UPI00094D111B|nr:cytochrome c [Sporosarcina ureilytica]
MKKKLLAAIFGATLVLGACGGGNDTSNETDTGTSGGDTAEVDAEAVVQQKCIACHGGNLEGASAPAISTAGANYSEDEIRDIIQNGKGGMPAIKMAEAEADAVAAWLAEKK